MEKPLLVICRKFFQVLILECYIPVALWGLGARGVWCFYTPSGSLSHSLSVRLIPLGLLEVGAQETSIALLNRSVDCTLQMYFSHGLLIQETSS